MILKKDFVNLVLEGGVSFIGQMEPGSLKDQRGGTEGDLNWLSVELDLVPALSLTRSVVLVNHCSPLPQFPPP